ncbi:aspartate/glutamate racemase family protein [Candidatus Bipolaricaulota bacterium]|nr:aspartate/glutamate racemase family protein [Candidatus Bipolaricaulota bacterium]
MRIKVIIPNASKEFLATQIDERQAAAGPGVEVTTICLEDGPVSLESGVDDALVAVPLMIEARKAQDEGYDAVVIDCAADPSVRAVREYIDIPVTSAGEAAFQYVLGLADTFSVVTVLENTAHLIEDRLRTYGLMSRVASVRFADVPVLDLEDMSLACERILSQARQAIDQDGADAIVLGCTGMSPVTKHLQQNLEVPVVDPAVAALTLAESLVRMGISHSKKSYLTPPKKKVEGSMYAGWKY